MLHTKTIEPGTLSLLNELMLIPTLKQFCLVGGTALSLKYGHRISMDLDLFSEEKINKEQIISILQSKYAEKFVYESTQSSWSLFCYIDNIKVDFVYYPHKIIGKIEQHDSIRLISDKDLIAMKFQAILGRGQKKDFWDIAELLENYSISDMIQFHSTKFPNQMLAISIPQALVYFEDADQSEDPISLKLVTWNEVKTVIKEKVRIYLT